MPGKLSRQTAWWGRGRGGAKALEGRCSCRCHRQAPSAAPPARPAESLTPLRSRLTSSGAPGRAASRLYRALIHSRAAMASLSASQAAPEPGMLMSTRATQSPRTFGRCLPTSFRRRVRRPLYKVGATGAFLLRGGGEAVLGGFLGVEVICVWEAEMPHALCVTLAKTSFPIWLLGLKVYHD